MGQQAPPLAATGEISASSHSTGQSVGTLVVVVAAIVILAVLAGVLARVCGGRYLVGEHDTEGWVESKCRSCIDGGVPEEAPNVVEEKK